MAISLHFLSDESGLAKYSPMPSESGLGYAVVRVAAGSSGFVRELLDDRPPDRVGQCRHHREEVDLVFVGNRERVCQTTCHGLHSTVTSREMYRFSCTWFRVDVPVSAYIDPEGRCSIAQPGIPIPRNS